MRRRAWRDPAHQASAVRGGAATRAGDMPGDFSETLLENLYDGVYYANDERRIT